MLERSSKVFRLARTAVLCFRCRQHCSTRYAYRFINVRDIYTISYLHDYRTLRRCCGCALLICVQNSRTAPSGFRTLPPPSKNFFHIGAPTVAYRTFPCLDKSFGRCPIGISLSKCKTHSCCLLLGGLSTLAHTLVCDRKTKTGGAAIPEGTQPQTANLLRRRFVAVDCCACRKRPYAARCLVATGHGALVHEQVRVRRTRHRHCRTLGSLQSVWQANKLFRS